MGDLGKAGTGAAAGAATGATIGSIVPGYGTAIGAGVGAVAGGLYGYFSGGDDDKAKSYVDRDQIHSVINRGLDVTGYGRSPPQIGQTAIDPTQQAQFRQYQIDQANRLNAIASGQQMGAGEMATRRAAQQAYAQQVGMANMQRGGGAPYAGLGAARNQTMISGNAAGQAQQAGLSDQQQANAQLTNALAQGRGADIGLATSQAQMNQAQQLANADMQMRQMGLDDQTRLAYLQQLAQMNATELTGQNAAAVASNQQNNALLGAGISAGGQILGAYLQNRGQVASDERLKKDVSDARDEMDEMLDALSPKSYSYKDEKFGAGRRAGIMAQDMERSKAGKRIVEDTPEGKMLDVNKALSAALAASARLNERVRKLEGERAP